MERLTEEHIHYIIKDLSYRGLVDEDIQEEMLDHICCVVEKEMASGERFFDAYQTALKSFGNTTGIQQLQRQVIHTKTKAKGMLKSYLSIALRNHFKNRFYTSINVIGLAIGIAACLIIMLYVVHELSYDRWNDEADRIYRVDTELRVGSVYHNLALGAASLPEHWSDYPEIESSVRMMNRGWYPVRREKDVEPMHEKHVWADSTFFRIFSIPVLEGEPHTALTEPHTVAISRKMAEKYFPEGDALNKQLLIGKENYGDDDVCRVTAVFDDLPDNSHFHVDIVRSMASSSSAKSVSLVGGGELHIYLLLKEGASPAQLERKFPAFVEEHVAPQLSAILDDFSMEKFREEGNIWRYSLTPLTDIHLHSDLEGELEANGSIVYVYLFSSVALFILAIACINFMNLSTARSTDRAREVGVRKVMGSLRSHLVRQFLTESFILSLVAFVLALGIAQLFLPVFNQLAQKDLSLPLGDYTFYVAMIGAALFVGVMAGLYPSFFLSGFKPVNVLKGKVVSVGRTGMIRSGLVVFQFVISIFLIVATIVIERQLNFIQNKKIGFNKDQVLVVHGAYNLGDQLQSFRDEILRNPFVMDGTISGYLPVEGTWRNNNTWWPEGKAPTGADVNHMVAMQRWDIDYDYINTLGMSLKTGRNFSPDFLADSSEHVILNEAAARAFEFGDDPIGKKISCFDGTNPDGTPDLNSIRTWTVIGVVEDFHFESMRNTITPVSFSLGSAPGYVSFRFAGGSTQQVLEAVEEQWNKMAPGKTFNYSFLDEDFGKMYASEQRLGTIFIIFTGLAIFIACLGLFALTAFTIQQRTKEIGIRKSLGASIESIVMLLSRSHGRLVLIAFVISVPVSWYAVNRWLESYSYKASIGVLEYMLAGALAFGISLLTIGYQAIRAARANPANSLRSE